ncbi:serine hydrolase domain-containing protein [Draconibacterium sp. IB214405]|uniref:serine hydrolase domain-containing protein n=1 Tax=Draconibacterium sp. IB214405 TaxID=3097352 RepID=UPI002A0DAA37|nr:serine hydrolase domain-containing protein [Draconibacterium sp. IB214405]MDX8339075.1 serine hydrolase domain-containing protein [Draconibacterium sp. IB214405]
MKNLYYLLILVLLSGVSCTKEDPKIKAAEDYIEQLRVESESVGWTATVSIDNNIVFSKGFGLGNYEQQVAVYPEKTKFRIGSISKALTAAGLGILIDEGKIDLDAPVQKYVPDFPEKKYQITTRQVAGHLAGIRHYNGDEFLSSKFYPTVKEGLEIFMNDTLLFEPGTQYSYSSYGFNLLSAVMEGASGEEFLQFMQTRVFNPIGMTETTAERMDSLILFRSGYYDMDKGKIINAPYVDNSYKWAGGGFISTSVDLVKFGNAMLNNTLFPEEVKQQLITPQTLKNGEKTTYGMGFSSGTDEFGREYFGHGGGSVGGCSNLIIYPKEKMVVAVITNDTRAKVGNELHKIVEILLGEEQ